MTADPVGGVWQYALELCASLGRTGDEILLATLGALPSGEQRRMAAALPGVELHASAWRLEWMPEPWADLERAQEWLLGLARAFRPDVVHLNHLVHADLDWGAPVLVVGHSCVLSWWSAVHGGEPPAEWARYQARVTRSLQGAHCVASPSQAMMSELQRCYGPLHHCAVVANGRDPLSVAPRRQPTAPREPLILAAGRVWDQGKNLAALAAVAPHLDWPVWVAGPTRAPQGGTVQLPHVRLLGPLGTDALASWYARAPIFAAPARYEPFGLSVLEAGLAGCALVLGDIPSLREVWGEAALYVAPEDHEALHSTLQALIREPARIEELGRRARQRARSYSPERCARAYRSLYLRLIEEREELLPPLLRARSAALMPRLRN